MKNLQEHDPSLFPLRRVRLLWHPESPGMRVPVRTLWFRRRDFATLSEVLRYYRAVELVEALRG